jgi:hypothetical protein
VGGGTCEFWARFASSADFPDASVLEHPPPQPVYIFFIFFVLFHFLAFKANLSTSTLEKGSAINQSAIS